MFFADISAIDPACYQSNPIRTSFFAIFTWLLSPDAANLRPRQRAIAYSSAAAAFRWNADTGLMLLVAFTGSAAYSRLVTRRSRASAVIC